MNAEELRRLRDELYVAELRVARTMTPDERVREGFRMYGRECDVARMLLRDANPGADDVRIEELLFAAIERFRTIEKAERFANLPLVEV